MSGTNHAPRVSTSREDAPDPRFSSAIGTTYNDGHTVRIHAADIQQHVAAATPASSPADNSTGFFAGSASGLAKLQTYLPTGTWVTYTALETWAFSLRPNNQPITPLSNCNANQRRALLIVLALSAAISLLSSFVKRFIYNASRTHVTFPPPDYFRVSESVTDPVTGVKFPCRTEEWRYCWPLVDASGKFVYDESSTRLRVAVFRADVPILLRPQRAWSWRALFEPELDDNVPLAPHLSTFPFHSARNSSSSARHMIPIDAVAAIPPELSPRWSQTLMASQGNTAYVDLSPHAWAHALVSLLAFLTLSLLSTQVSGCLYPGLPDFLSPPLQTGILALLSFVAAVVVQDRAVSLGQPTVRWEGSQGSQGEQAEVPEYLRSIVETVVWVGRQDASREKSITFNGDA